MSLPATDQSLIADYKVQNARVLARGLIVANVIAIAALPGGFILDYFLYPHKFGEFLAFRFGGAIVLAAWSGLLYLAGKYAAPVKIKILGVLSALTVNASMCLMIRESNGATSPYYVGVILVLTCWSTLAPWTVVETISLCVGSLAIYVAACVTNPSFNPATSIPLLGFGASFILVTTAICIGMTLFLSRVRFDDFRLRHQLDTKNRQLEELDRVKTQFFSNVSHELRTPLTLILGPVEGLLSRGDAFDARVHESLILIQRNSLRLLKLINDLLDLTRIDQGAAALRTSTLSLGPFIKGIVDSVRHLGMTKQLRIKVQEGGPAVDATIDAARVEKVLVNLLTNAIKYTPPGGSITVRWGTVENGVTIEVEDTGVGIPPEDISKIFDRFHQVRSNVTNQTQGIGIGLSLVKELVEGHGGRIEVESVVDKGSRFRVILPNVIAAPEAIQIEREQNDDDPIAEEPFEKAFRSADRTLRSYGDASTAILPAVGHGEDVVLVADDENDMRQYVVSLLAETYHVVQTQHGANVAAMVAEHEPGLVLLDWMMPGKDGLEVCRELRADPRNADLKIILLTARIDENSKIEALKSGADDFLTKPFSSIEVKTRVTNHLRVARLQRDLRARNKDLTETLERLKRTEAMLIQSEKMNAVGSMSAGLLHEINNPLNYSLTAISLLRQYKDTLSPDMQEMLADIEEGMTRIRDVITHLKHFAYPEKAGTLSSFPIAEAIESAMKLVGRELDGAAVRIDLPQGLVVQGQKTQLMHVFINLLSNAAKALAEFPPNGSKLISISGHPDGETATIEVADNGPGVAPDVIGRIFEPFFTTRDVGAGMGLGLSICHTIIEAHGGSISVTNRPEGGALFTIHIPLAQEALKLC
jgi:signal transduction histidine kinase